MVSPRIEATHRHGCVMATGPRSSCKECMVYDSLLISFLTKMDTLVREGVITKAEAKKLTEGLK